MTLGREGPERKEMMLTDLVKTPTTWQPIASAPTDGTPVLIAQGSLVGIYAFYQSGKTLAGRLMRPTWHGVHVLSEFEPMTRPDGTPTGDKVIQMSGIDDDALWMPLPEVATHL